MTNEQHIENLKKLKSFHNGSYGADIDRAVQALKQEPKTGRWIKTISENGVTSAVRCSKCGFEDNRYMFFRYCPHCGTKMVDSQERSGEE